MRTADLRLRSCPRIKMNLSNKLTLSRFGMAFVMVVFLTAPIPFGKTTAFLLFAIAALTDYWDGRLARTSCGVTVFGQFMDPLADKTLVCAAFISFAAANQIVPAWIVTVIITREFMVTGLRLIAANQGRIIPAGRWGKHKTAWQIVAIIIIILGMSFRDDILPMLISESSLNQFCSLYFDKYFGCITFLISGMVAALTVISGTIYFWSARELVMTDV